MYMEAYVARTLVNVCILAFKAYIAQQASQQGHMSLLVGGIQRVQAPALLSHQRGQLAMHITPFTQPQRRQEVLAQQGRQLALRCLVLDLLAIRSEEHTSELQSLM